MRPHPRHFSCLPDFLAAVARYDRREHAPAIYAGYQEGFADVGGFDCYRLTADILGHPVGSTVAAQTLTQLGYHLPAKAQEPPQITRQRAKDSHNPFTA